MTRVLLSIWSTWLIAVFSLSSAVGAELLPKPFSALGDTEFRVRETAQAELLGWARSSPDKSLDEVFKQSQISKDPEVRERCLVILRQLVKDQYMLEGKGFVGIERDNRIAEIPGKRNPCHVVAVKSVSAGTPADRAGIKINDLIVSLNGVGWSDEDASTVFANQIAAMRPGTKVLLAIFREGKMTDIEVILTRRPLSAEYGAQHRFFGGQDFDPKAADRAAMENYFREWLNKKKIRG